MNSEISPHTPPPPPGRKPGHYGYVKNNPAQVWIEDPWWKRVPWFKVFGLIAAFLTVYVAWQAIK